MHWQETKYSTRDLTGGHTGNNFSVLDVKLNEKEPSVEIQLLNIFKDYRIVADSGPAAPGYERWSLSNPLCTKFDNGHGKFKLESSEYFQMYQCQLSFAMFYATSTLDIT